MNPVIHEGFPRCRLGLGHLVLVMGEDQVAAAGVDVYGLAKEVEGHGAAFDMPAGPSLSPGALPGWFTLLPILPEDEVKGVALPGIHLDTGPERRSSRDCFASFP